MGQRGRPTTGKVWGTKMPIQPIKLKKLLADCSIAQRELAPLVGVSAATINLCCNKGYFPETFPKFKEHVEEVLENNQTFVGLLKEQELEIGDIWAPLGAVMKQLKPANLAERQSRARKGLTRTPAIAPGNIDDIETKEVEMLSPEACRKFKFFMSPFNNDIQKDSDVFMSDEHRFIMNSMLAVAEYGGFLAVVGEVGSGKTTMRRKVIEQLRREGKTQIIYPRILDKSRVSAGSLGDAIIMDISDETPRMRLEAKGRQVHRLLLARNREDYRHVLIMEEAHQLSVSALKFLKQLHEVEDGYKKLLGIILIGQTEMHTLLDESQHPDMREVIARVQVANISGLNGSLKDYLSLKFHRFNRKLEEIMTDEAIDLLSSRLTMKDGNGRKISRAYPLRVNDLVTRAMNLAADMGEDRVSADVIQAL